MVGGLPQSAPDVLGRWPRVGVAGVRPLRPPCLWCPLPQSRGRLLAWSAPVETAVTGSCVGAVALRPGRER